MIEKFLNLLHGKNQNEASDEETLLPDPVLSLLNDLKVKDLNQRETIKNYLQKVENREFIQEYINNTLGETHTFSEVNVIETYEINRPKEEINFRKNLGNRRLLWHGTKKENLYSIITNGFDLKFGNEGRMFGKGIYFSDCFTKSLNYCDNYYPIYSVLFNFSIITYEYLLLYEVALGNIEILNKEFSSSGFNDVRKYGNSVLGKGKWSTSEGKHDEEGVMICSGKLQESQNLENLLYDEFVVYNTNQICLRYLVKICIPDLDSDIAFQQIAPQKGSTIGENIKIFISITFKAFLAFLVLPSIMLFVALFFGWLLLEILVFVFIIYIFIVVGALFLFSFIIIFPPSYSFINILSCILSTAKQVVMKYL